METFRLKPLTIKPKTVDSQKKFVVIRQFAQTEDMVLNQIIIYEALKIYRCFGLSLEHCFGLSLEHSDSVVWGGEKQPVFFFKCLIMMHTFEENYIVKRINGIISILYNVFVN